MALMFAGGKAWGIGSFADGVVISRHEIDYLRPVDDSHRSGHRRAGTHGADRDVGVGAPGAPVHRRLRLFDGDALASRARSVFVPFDLAERPRGGYRSGAGVPPAVHGRDWS